MTDYHDLRPFLTAVAEHECDEHRHIEVKDEQGTTIDNTWLGFACTACSEWWRYSLGAAKAMPIPIRGYLNPKTARIETARRLDVEPKVILLEMRNSGGWDQPDPGVAFLTMMAAAMGPPGNPMEQKLNQMVAGKPKPQ